MRSIKEILEEKISPLLGTSAEVTRSTRPEFGHYQVNNAMKLAKERKQNPRAIAMELKEQIEQGLSEWVEKAEVAGPGFINLHLQKSFLAKELDEMVRDRHLGIEQNHQKQKVIVEFSSPNIAKPLHVGHLRSTIIGEAIARLFEFYDYEVLRLNHVGDWGTQFGMLIAYLREQQKEVLDGGLQVSCDLLLKFYKESKQLFDVDPAFKKRAQESVVELQARDEESVKIWERICDISRQGFNEIYDLLGVHLVERGESFYNPMLQEVCAECEKEGLVTESDGAKCIFLEGYKTQEDKPLPMILQKSDGGFNYSTTDVAALRHRVRDEKADWIIYITDLGQQLHFKMVFDATQKAGYWSPEKVRIDHVTFGLVLNPDGKKMKTREGDNEQLIDLIYRAIDKAKGIFKERLPDLPESEIDHMARVIGTGAIKYADLSTKRNNDYIFSYDKMLQFEGNTAVAIIYSYVRIQSIFKKAGVDLAEVEKAQMALEHPSEVALGLHLRRFSDALEAMREELLPNRLTEYLYELSDHFNAFFRDCQVVGSSEEKPRLLLCTLTQKVLKQGLNILGIETLERM
ncbi:MAG: Arginine--tRNA ligase [Chlamydiia bacterium]|nr:Arginine--tRNA ligase [Chlamydiia bacterium]